MKKKFLFLGLMAAVSLTACNTDNTKHEDAQKVANEQNEDKKEVKENDGEFMTEAASGGLMEVRLGQLAATNAKDVQVKQFGQQMVDDHSKANEELTALARQKNITIPTVPDNDKQKKIDDLASKKGADFDKAYADLMVDDHESDIKNFKKAGDNASDADIKSWAAGKVATLEHHLEMAKTMKDKVKDSK